MMAIPWSKNVPPKQGAVDEDLVITSDQRGRIFVHQTWRERICIAISTFLRHLPGRIPEGDFAQWSHTPCKPCRIWKKSIHPEVLKSLVAGLPCGKFAKVPNLYDDITGILMFYHTSPWRHLGFRCTELTGKISKSNIFPMTSESPQMQQARLPWLIL